MSLSIHIGLGPLKDRFPAYIELSQDGVRTFGFTAQALVQREAPGSPRTLRVLYHADYPVDADSPLNSLTDVSGIPTGLRVQGDRLVEGTYLRTPNIFVSPDGDVLYFQYDESRP